MSNKCSFVKENGLRCNAFSLKDSEYCFSHSPEHKEQKIAAVTRGGMAKKYSKVVLAPISIKEPQDIIMLLDETVNLVRKSMIAPSVANSVGYLCGVMIKSFEVINFDKRLTELENRFQFTND